MVKKSNNKNRTSIRYLNKRYWRDKKMTFQPIQALQKAVESKNIRNIRSAISSYMVSDPTDSRGEIHRAVRHVESNGIKNLWEPHDNEQFKNKNEWDKEYYGVLQAELMFNFSKERFNHALEVGRTVYRKNSKENNNTSKTSATSKWDNKSPSNNRNESDIKKFLPVLIGIGMAAAAVIIYLVNKE